MSICLEGAEDIICQDTPSRAFLIKKTKENHFMNRPILALHWQLSGSMPVNDNAPQPHDVQGSFLKPGANELSGQGVHGELGR